MSDRDEQTGEQTDEGKTKSAATAVSAPTAATDAAEDDVGGYLMDGGEEELQTFFGRH